MAGSTGGLPSGRWFAAVTLVAAAMCCVSAAGLWHGSQMILPRVAGKPPASARFPVCFEENRGQAVTKVRFVARGLNHSVFLTGAEAVLALRPPREPRNGKRAASLRMKLARASTSPRIFGDQKLPGRVNYYRGNDPARWQQNVPLFGKVRCEQVYPGIDVVYYGTPDREAAGGTALEHDFIVSPSADPEQIRMAFEGAETAAIDKKGDLVLGTPGGDVRLRKPFAYQELNGFRVTVASEYALSEAPRTAGPEAGESAQATREVGFRVAAYDPARPLIIDPVLEYGTYLGGSGEEHGAAVAVDNRGDVAIAGTTNSFDFPTHGMGDTQLASAPDVFVAKFTGVTGQLEYATYLGGSLPESNPDLAVDGNGNVLVTGGTDSVDFPTTANAFQRINRPPTPSTPATKAAFVTKLSGAGGSILYSTFFGGSTTTDTGLGIATEPGTRVSVVGMTRALFRDNDFPVTSTAFDTTYNGGDDLFVTKLDLGVADPTPGDDQNEAALVYSTFFGGGADEPSRDTFSNFPRASIAADARGRMYVTGQTRSPENVLPFFPTKNAMQPVHRGGGTDAFVARFDPSEDRAASLLYSTYLGGVFPELSGDIAVDSAGQVYVTGTTMSAVFPGTKGGAMPGNPLGNSTESGFISLFNSAGALLQSTFVGGLADTGGNGTAKTQAWGLALGRDGSVWSAGHTRATDFPVSADAFDQRLAGRSEGFVAQFAANLKTLVYATYLGGGGDELLGASGAGDLPGNLDVDRAGNVWVVGTTTSLDFPVVDPAQTFSSGNEEAFLVRISSEPAPAAPLKLTGRTISSTRIDLAWSDNSHNESAFEIQRGDGREFGRIALVGADISFYSDLDLIPDTMYSYRVRAVNAAGFSAFSPVVTRATFPLPPDPPFNLRAATLSASEVRLDWETTDNTDSNIIEVAREDGSFTAEPNPVGDVTTSIVSGLSAGTRFRFRVRARGQGGTSAPSNVAEATTLAPPAAPSNLAAVALSASQVRLTWQDNSADETAFAIDRLLSDGSIREQARTAANAVTFTDTGLTAGTTFVYLVRALRGADSSAPSNSATATTLTPPAAPTNLSANLLQTPGVQLAWTDNSSDETGFRVERKVGTGAFTQIRIDPANSFTFADTSPTPDALNTYRVFAVSAGGDSAPSNEAAVTAPARPAAPTNLTATAVDSSQITLAWSDNSNNENGFGLQRKIGTGTFQNLSNRPANATAFTEGSLAANTSHTYRLRAFNAGGNSSFTNESSATTLGQPADLTAVALSETKVQLDWTDHSRTEEGFEVQRSSTGRPWARIATVGPEVVQYLDRGLLARTRYQYRVRAFSAGAVSTWCPDWPSVTTFARSRGNLVAPRQVSFGAVTVKQAVERDLVLRNTSPSQTLSVSIPRPGAPFSVVSGGGQVAVSPGGRHVVKLRFHPGIQGAARGILALFSSDGQEPCKKIRLIGIGE